MCYSGAYRAHEKKSRKVGISGNFVISRGTCYLSPMADVGRPTKYQDSYPEQAEKLCKLGATDAELADFFNVVESTLNLWKVEYPEFSEAIKAGKTLADANVADRLYQRAMGFEHDSEEIKVVSDGQGAGSSIERVPIRKIYPPDTTAAIFWLKNRQRDKWRDKTETELTGKDGGPVQNELQIKIIRDKGNTVTPGDTASESTEGT